MRSPDRFVVKPVGGKRYENTKKMGSIDFITSTSTENHKASNRYAEVVSTPLNYSGPISSGDILLVHHNVFKFYNDMKGRQRSGRSFFKDDEFFIDNEQYFLYKKDGKWHAKDGFCFLRPLEKTHDLVIDTLGKTQPLVGELVYGCDQTEKMGLSVGDVVSYLPDVEYEFNVDGETLYRLYTKHVVMKL